MTSCIGNPTDVRKDPLHLSPDSLHHIRKWLEWVSHGAPQGAPYGRQSGLCSNVKRTFSNNDQAHQAFSEICDVMSRVFGDPLIFHRMDVKYRFDACDNYYRKAFFHFLLDYNKG